MPINEQRTAAAPGSAAAAVPPTAWQATIGKSQMHRRSRWTVPSIRSSISGHAATCGRPRIRAFSWSNCKRLSLLRQDHFEVVDAPRRPDILAGAGDLRHPGSRDGRLPGGEPAGPDPQVLCLELLGDL